MTRIPNSRDEVENLGEPARRPAPCGIAALAAGVCAIVAGCEAGPAARAISVDTLESGAVRVSSPARGLWDPAAAWHLVEELRIGAKEGSGPGVFSQVVDLAVDGQGRIYVLDRQAKEVRVFDRSGGHVRTIGRSGSGPGEFRDPVALTRDPRGRLWVVDTGNGRYSAFDTTGAYVEARPRSLGGYTLPWPGGFDRGGRLYDSSIGRRPSGDGFVTWLVRIDSGGTPVDTFRLPDPETPEFVLRQENGMIAARVPFAPGLVWRFDPRGYIWLAFTDRYRIVQRDLSGDTTRIVEKEYEPAPVTEEDRAEAVERLDWFVKQGGKVDPSRIPDRKPPFTTFHVARDGTLWVWPILSDPEETTGRVLEVFDRQGRYLGRARSEFPVASSPAPVFRGDRVHAITADELGVQYVVRARIEGRDTERQDIERAEEEP